MGKPGIILDQDGLATSDSPFLIYANPKFDLTGSVKKNFLRLREEAASTAEAAGTESK